MRKNVSVGRIIIAVFTVIFTLSLVMFLITGISEIKDAVYEPDYVDEETYLLALNDQEYLYLLETTNRDLRFDKTYSDKVKECQAVARYYEAASLYKAYAEAGDEEAAQEQKERMEKYAGQTGEYAGHVEEIKRIFEIEEI